MPLDSDIQHGDDQLHVTFYESTLKGYEGVPFIRIVVPGDRTNIIDRFVRSEDKARFPRHWLAYQMDNAEGQVIGTLLNTWHMDRPEEFTRNELEEMQILKFQTVEQIATANDKQLQKIGMGAAGMRTRAQAYLVGKNANIVSDEHAKTQRELVEMKEQMAALQAMLTPRKPGRPKKVDSDVNDDDVAVGATGS